MGKVGILTEKPSAARNFAKALGGMSGTYDGDSYVIVAARGHLLELKDPAAMVPASKREQYESWDLEHLPWDDKDFVWEREVRKKLSGKKMVTDPDAKALLADLGKALGSCSEIVIASDIDPTGEGDLLAWEIVDHLGLTTAGKAFSRMEFLDEAPASIQKAFTGRRPVKSMQDEGGYRKAEFRSRWDMLSMQFTRVATKVSGGKTVLRNGRLKSAMVKLVGDGLDAHNSYVKKPFYENRFRDENGVVYSDPETDRFEDKAQVPGGLAASDVVDDGVKRKKTAPPKLLDLAGLSALLSKRGVGAKDVLAIYQKLYEAQIVSYPRTEDKFVSEEQFKELLPLVDKIAAVVGVNPADLTVRTARKSHVKNGGAHGANRPGLNVPASLEAVEKTYGKTGRMIYETLAKNYLTMLAPDYEYDQHSGHVKDYPSYTGSVNVPAVMGWKGVFVVDDEDAPDEASAGLGTRAEPFVHEGFPPRPPHPNMTWLMKQLEKHSVGTGATRTSTYAEVTNNKTGKALMVEKRGRITLSEIGELNHRLLPGTHIGDLALTERVYADMKAIENGTLTAEEALAPVAELVEHDLKKMTENAGKVPAELRERLMKSGNAGAEKFSGEWNGGFVTFKREWAGHRFTDAECEDLCAGKEIAFEATAKNGKAFNAKGKLAVQTFTADDGTDKEFVGFEPDFTPDLSVYGVGTWNGREVKFRRSFGEYKFSDAEVADLLAGKTIEIEVPARSGGGTNKLMGKLADKTFVKGRDTIKYVGFDVDRSATHSRGTWKGREVEFKSKGWGANDHWKGHDFTPDEVAKLLAGELVSFEATSKKGKPYSAKGRLGDGDFGFGFQLEFDKR